MRFFLISACILMTMPKNKRIDLLFQLFQCQLMIVPHPDVFFDSVIFTGRNIDRMISAVTQTLRDQTGISPIRFDPLALLGEHG